MSNQSAGAVFLSYASQDSESAQRIAAALVAAGVDVWLDQSGLKGGAAWDTEIRRRIHECALFIPIISANTESRQEGYFRLEWRLAEQRTHLMVRGKPFLLPVVIDGTRDDGALVPDAFLDVQWTRLVAGEGAASFARHIKDLLSPAETPRATHVGSNHGYQEATPATRGPRRRPSALPVLAGAGLLLIGGATVAWVLWDKWIGRATSSQTHSEPAATPGSGAALAAVAAPRTAIAVMPFANLTGDASKDFLGDGMAEELINKLSRLEGLRVPARTSTFSYKGRNADARQIARDLNVGTILEGSVRSAGAMVRITAQLVDAQTDSHLWSETYDRKLTDLFKLQDELAAAIAQALQVNLHGVTPIAAVSQAPPTRDLEAYQLYLQASALNDRPSTGDLRIVELASQAVQRDPAFGHAYGVLSFAHINLYQNGRSGDHLAAARDAAYKALQLGPDALATSVLSHVSAMAGRFVDMETRDRDLLAQASTDANAMVLRASHLMSAGRLRAALEAAQRAYALAPANARAVAVVARVLHEQGQDTQAEHFAQISVALGSPAHNSWLLGTMAKAARRRGEFDQAAELYVAVLSGLFGAQSDRNALAGIVRAVYGGLADPTRRAAALAALERLYPALRAATTNAVVRVRTCGFGTSWYVALGDIDRAYALALRCGDLGDQNSIGTLAQAVYVEFWDPEMRPFRRDPRFQSYISRSGLMDYWQQYGPPDDCDLGNGKLSCD